MIDWLRSRRQNVFTKYKTRIFLLTLLLVLHILGAAFVYFRSVKTEKNRIITGTVSVPTGSSLVGTGIHL